MDRDFHYHVTYIAALTAGFPTQVAVSIAKYAQYVDDCMPFENYKKQYEHGGKRYAYISTCAGVTENIVMSKLGINAMWMPFHFLPGNFKYKDDKGKRNYLEYNGILDKNERVFQLLCVPKSCMAEKMINEIIRINNETSDDKLYLLPYIGIVSHVLADTVAHAFFSGQMHKKANSVKGDIVNVTGGAKSVIGFKTPWGEWRSKSVPWHKSINYLGHARAGHIPDYSDIDYKYVPQWNAMKKQYVIHMKHSETYIFAFKILVQALYCIRKSMPFQFNTEYTNYKYKNAIDVLPALQAQFVKANGLYHEQLSYEDNVSRRCEGYEKVISSLHMDKLPAYNKKEITGNYVLSKTFNYAALKHFLFVKKGLDENEFNVFDELDGADNECEISLRLQAEFEKYIPNAEGNETYLEENYYQTAEDHDLELDGVTIDVKDGPVDPDIDKFFYFFENGNVKK